MSIDTLLKEVSDKDLASIKNFAKVDSTIEDDLLKIWILAARKKVITQVGSEIDDFFDDNPIFQAAVMIDVYTHYNNRDADSNAMIFTHPAYQNDINALKDDYRDLTVELDDEDLDDG